MTTDGNQQTALDRVETTNTSGVYEFVAVFTTPAGEVRIPLPVEAMVSYSAFQKTILLSSGYLYRVAECEGRPEPSADEQHKGQMRLALERGVPQA